MSSDAESDARDDASDDEPQEASDIEDLSERASDEEEEDEEDEEEEELGLEDEGASASTGEAELAASAAAPTAPSAGATKSEFIVVVPADARRTSHIMSMSEFTEIISLRTEQIAADGMRGAMVTLDEVPNATCARDIAIAEVRMRRCPLKLIRQVGAIPATNGSIKKYVEIWSPNAMVHPAFQ